MSIFEDGNCVIEDDNIFEYFNCRDKAKLYVQYHLVPQLSAKQQAEFRQRNHHLPFQQQTHTLNHVLGEQSSEVENQRTTEQNIDPENKVSGDQNTGRVSDQEQVENQLCVKDNATDSHMLQQTDRQNPFPGQQSGGGNQLSGMQTGEENQLSGTHTNEGIHLSRTNTGEGEQLSRIQTSYQDNWLTVQTCYQDIQLEGRSVVRTTDWNCKPVAKTVKKCRPGKQTGKAN